LLATGEMVSVALMSMAIEELGEEAEGFPGYFAGIKTDSVHTKARIMKIDPARIRKELEAGKIVVVAGFRDWGRKTSSPPWDGEAQTLRR
ncbi:MAG TPA: aspartate kinase, partial [bacterium]|nr:aspartate kinase [bacterium]